MNRKALTVEAKLRGYDLDRHDGGRREGEETDAVLCNDVAGQIGVKQ
jgi:hypothetical protein